MNFFAVEPAAECPSDIILVTVMLVTIPFIHLDVGAATCCAHNDVGALACCAQQLCL